MNNTATPTTATPATTATPPSRATTVTPVSRARLERGVVYFEKEIATRLREVADLANKRDGFLERLRRLPPPPQVAAGTSTAAVAARVVANPPNRGLIGNVDTVPRYRFAKSVLTPSGHNSQMRCLQFLNTNPSEFLIGAADSYISKWELSFPSNRPRPAAPVVKHRLDVKAELKTYAPDAIAINPFRESVVAVYGKLEQFQSVSLVQKLPEGETRCRIVAESPHPRGISRVAFMTQNDNNENNLVLVTAGSQHKVVTWKCVEGKWEPTVRHQRHTNTITDICCVAARSVILTAARDKQVLGYDCGAQEVTYKQRIDVPCLGMAINPCDPNLVCIQTGEEGAQLRLYDMRRQKRVKQGLGWKNSSDVSKKLLNAGIMSPAWSSDGWMLSAGTAEKDVRVFDIRYSVAKNPTQVIRGHEKRVFKVAWAPVEPVLMSISMDRKIGMHRLISIS